MITIKGFSETNFEIKKSKFLGLACHVENEDEIKNIIEQRKKQYFDATHNCYAYLLKDGRIRYSDDGEPQGTAGLPMLEVLKNSGLSDVLVISTRYFGGTLLGAGGLARAYSKSASDTLAAADIIELTSCVIYECDFPYDIWARAQKPLLESGCVFNNINYSGSVFTIVNVRSENEASFLEQLKSLSLGQVTPILKGKSLTEMPPLC